jgi:5'(3')-deoxyribonucleotidase
MFNNDSKNFKDFMLSEYSNIAEAHFKSIETISTFFRYYLLIMTIPISVVAIISQQFGLSKEQFVNLMTLFKIPISITFISISFMGIGMFCYIVNLRLDAVLYARVVNGIRKFFYDKFDEDINLKIRLRVLPQSPQLPPYFEKSFFLPVVFVFGVMNSLYFFFGLWIVCKIKSGIIIGSIIFFFLHFLIYLGYSRHREIGYLKSNILGIDIDGVLNKHRKHFCEILRNNVGRNIDPEKILIIPVDEDPNLKISKPDERKVFNDPRYWKEMPVLENASDKIKSLRNIFNLKIYIFTYRPWPDCRDKGELIEKIKLFCNNYNDFISQPLKNYGIKFKLKWWLIENFKDKPLMLFLNFGLKLRWQWVIEKLKEKPLELITKQWLIKNGILYDKFIFERGNDYSSDPRVKFNNRFYISRKAKIRFFVEDDFEKAIKLSFICDIVFLFSQPYNTPNKILSENINKLRENIPSNIIRVKNWDEIYQYIRRLA